MIKLDDIDWEKTSNLVPAIVQDVKTLQVLMLGYMNKEALDQSIQSGYVTFYSRSKERLWTKGEESGNFLYLKDILFDCDRDTILIKALPKGATCHTGARSCFSVYAQSNSLGIGFLSYLKETIALRSQEDPSNKDSYTNQLIRAGKNRVAQKIGEEGVETALSLATGGANLKDEYADLFYHMLVGLQISGLELEDIIKVLEQRHNK